MVTQKDANRSFGPLAASSKVVANFALQKFYEDRFVERLDEVGIITGEHRLMALSIDFIMSTCFKHSSEGA